MSNMILVLTKLILLGLSEWLASILLSLNLYKVLLMIGC